MGRWLGILLILASSLSSRAAWAAVPPADLSKFKPADFDDSELDVPFFLYHFHTVANAVVETGEDRGFLNIKVNREPRDNQPYNARIQENTLPFAYFYATRRPWNSYYGSQALRERIEAMLQFWCKIQNPETGLFSEYKPQGWGLAPTGFGVLAMSRTLELLAGPDAPKIDSAILEQTMQCQRKAILALLTRDDCYVMGKSCSNQYSGVYRAAMAYLTMRPDAEMESALYSGAERAFRETQSPTHYMYEASGVDVGYSSVHDNNLRYAWPLVEKFPRLKTILLKNQEDWNTWLSYDLVNQPGTNYYFVNAGVNSRTAFAIHTPTVRPWSEQVEVSRAFAVTEDEHAKQLAEKRRTLEANWPKVKELVVPNAYSYQGNTLFHASTSTAFHCPTEEECAAAIAGLPYLASKHFTRLSYDPRQPTGFMFVRRPSYYAVFNFGKILVKNQQCYGLGLLWNDKLGTVLQSVGGSEWMCGTNIGGQIVEKSDVKTEICSGDRVIKPLLGNTDISGEDISGRYVFPQGRKTVRMDADGLAVSVECEGEFTEQLPLVKYQGETLQTNGNSVSLSRNGATFIIEFDGAIKCSVGEAKAIDKAPAKFERMMIRLAAKGRLSYRLRFE